MTPEHANLRIAEAIGDEGWRPCPCTWTQWGMRGIPKKDCPACHGKGKVPKDWGDKSNTLELWDWFHAWGLRNPQGYKAMCWVRQVFYQWLGGNDDCTTHAANIRNLIAEALKEK